MMTKLLCALIAASALTYLIDHQAGGFAAFASVLVFFVIAVFRDTAER